MVYLGLGSNLGDRRAALASAVTRLEQAGVRVVTRSGLYRTDPVEVVDQQEFINQVVAAETNLDPRGLLKACLEVERAMGRVRTRAKGPRTIDIDLLLLGTVVRSEPGLVIPHPRLHERRFVLVPLAEIAPGLVHPILGVTIAELLARCPDRSRVERDPSL